MTETIRHKIEEAKILHNGKYNYDKFDANKVIDNGIITCPIHGDFQQSMHSHLKGQGCPKCGIERRANKKRDTQESFIRKATKKHNGKYDYSKVEYIDMDTDVCLICPEHGEFMVKPKYHLMNNQGCPLCGIISRNKKLSSNNDEFIKKSRTVHGNKYDYSKVEYEKSNVKVRIICPEHGEFWQTPSDHLSGSGCSKCARERIIASHRLDTATVITRSKEKFGDFFNYDKTVFVDSYTPITITCPIHGDFQQKFHYHMDSLGCPMCAKERTTSVGENELKDFLKSICGCYVKFNDRTLIHPLEIDMFVVDKNIGVEYDGLYWHNEMKVDNNFHINKTEQCNAKGVRLIHIFEDEWLFKRSIVESRLRSIFGCIENKIYARKCEIREVSAYVGRKFLEENHIQGWCSSQIRYGLYYKDELVSLMTFGKLRRSLGNRKSVEGEFELLRFCNKLNTTVVGGASRLLKHFMQNNCFTKIYSYADKRWSEGGMYERLGFTHLRDSRPSYFYVIGEKRHNRYNYRKDILVKEGYDKSKSEHEIMLERGIYRIYDCGTKVYVLEKSN